MLKLWFLLLSYFSLMPMPRRWRADYADLPKALYLLPIWGLGAGLIAVLVANISRLAYFRWSAALFVALFLLFNGGIWLRDLLIIANGKKGSNLPTNQPKPADKQFLPQGQTYSRGAYAVVFIYILLQYLAFWQVFAFRLPWQIWPSCLIISRWIYIWGAYDFALSRHNIWYRALSRRSFYLISLICLALIAYFSYGNLAIIMALLSTLLMAKLFYTIRIRTLSHIDEAAQGAAAAWAEIIFIWSLILFWGLGGGF